MIVFQDRLGTNNRQGKLKRKTVSRSGATEIPQLYITVPRQPAPLPVPQLALQGFTKVQLPAQQSATISFKLVPAQFCTVRTDGRCEVRDSTSRLRASPAAAGRDACASGRMMEQDQLQAGYC